jgi:hypothetical protein
MMTGLDITGSMYPYKYKGSTRQKGVKTWSGYKSYIQNHMKDGPLSEVEYKAFLNMWLCRFIFCGKVNEPTLNHIAMAEDLATGHRVPKVPPWDCVSYAPSDHLSNAQRPEDIMCQRPLVVCTDVAATIHAPDC